MALHNSSAGRGERHRLSVGSDTEEEIEAAARERHFPAPISDNEQEKCCHMHPVLLGALGEGAWENRPILQKRKLRTGRLICPSEAVPAPRSSPASDQSLGSPYHPFRPPSWEERETLDLR